TGFAVTGPFLPLESVVQRGGKRVHAWAAEGDWDPTRLHSNRCTIEYPPHSGRLMDIPEVDRAEWYSLDVAAQKINPAQVVWLRQLIDALKVHHRGA
ncbi:MAG: NUDIX hydrolase, partial [Vicinamibacterales bacterium]